MRRSRENNYTFVAILASLAVALPPGSGALYAQEIAPSKAVGKVIGKVRLEGRFDKPPPLKVYKNRDFCGNEVANESLLVSPSGGLQNAVIILRGAETQRKKSMRGGLILDNRNCAFVPRVQVAPTGSEILLMNSDPILHDAHARLGRETLFNVGLPQWRRVKKSLEQEGIVKVQCEVLHTWQTAYIVVTSSPYFAVTDETGEFVIEGVPAGGYQMEAWHERLGTLSTKFVVTAGKTHKAGLLFQFD